jgi:hydrogenase/urease accessory protein HupE
MKKRVNTIFVIICIVDIIVSLILIDVPGINIAVIIISLFFLGILYYIVRKLLYLEELLLAINRREDNKEIHEKIM